MLSALSPAKINLFLEVTDKRPDGFHNIDSVFLEIDLADRLTVKPAEELISVECGYPGIPHGPDNLIVRAVELLREAAGVRKGATFLLEKHIPMGAGLGGGSSNAAAALRLANELWNTGLSDSELAALGAKIGSDIPFFFHGGTCLCRGRGEIIERMPAFPCEQSLGLILPGISSNTAAAYRGIRLPHPGRERHAADFISALANHDVSAMRNLAFNRFERTVFAALPTIARIAERLEAHGVSARLSGSGSALWFFGASTQAEQALSGLPNIRILEVRAFNRPSSGEIYKTVA